MTYHGPNKITTKKINIVIKSASNYKDIKIVNDAFINIIFVFKNNIKIKKI